MTDSVQHNGTLLNRWQFSLRALFIVILIFGAVCGIAISKYRSKQNSIDRLANLGATLSFDYQWSNSEGWRPDVGVPGIWMLQATLGRHYAANPVEVQLFASPSMKPDEFDDEDAAMLASLPTIKWMVLQDTKLTDTGLMQLSAISLLERLDIEGTLVTAEGVEKFQVMRPEVKVSH